MGHKQKGTGQLDRKKTKSFKWIWGPKICTSKENRSRKRQVLSIVGHQVPSFREETGQRYQISKHQQQQNIKRSTTTKYKNIKFHHSGRKQDKDIKHQNKNNNKISQQNSTFREERGQGGELQLAGEGDDQ